MVADREAAMWRLSVRRMMWWLPTIFGHLSVSPMPRLYRLGRTSVGVMILTLTLATGVAALRQKPVDVLELHESGGARALSLEHLTRMSSLVVEGIVVAAVSADEIHPTADNEPPAVLVLTTYEIQVTDLLSRAGAREAPQRVFLTLVGGDRDEGRRILRHQSDKFPLLEKGYRYIFFLVERDGRYVPATGDSLSTIQINGADGSLRVYNNESEVARQVKARGRAALESDVRSQRRD